MAEHLQAGLIVAATHGPLLAGARELRIDPALGAPPGFGPIGPHRREGD